MTLVNRANTAPLFSTKINGWTAVMTVDPDGLRTSTGSVDTSQGADVEYTRFLLTLIRDYGQWG
ncbi:hypothetical protein [Nocardia harenae]|uniref:hypothetical protein n=1 Tax=Nocardia harenae TaxID=358707 RepID=UPI00082A235A|nr:hypothetical protein [Nocardia harenae]